MNLRHVACRRVLTPRRARMGDPAGIRRPRAIPSGWEERVNREERSNQALWRDSVKRSDGICRGVRIQRGWSISQLPGGTGSRSADTSSQVLQAFSQWRRVSLEQLESAPAQRRPLGRPGACITHPGRVAQRPAGTQRWVDCDVRDALAAWVSSRENTAETHTALLSIDLKCQ